MRVLDVPGLGWDAARVTIDGETILLVEPSLDVDERIDLLTQAMGEHDDDPA